MADLLNRLSGDVDDAPTTGQGKLPIHQFFAALLAIADGKLTTTQVKTAFDIQVGTQTTQFDTIVTLYTGITDADATELKLKQEKFLSRLHAVFMLSEHQSFSDAFTKAEINTWLAEVAAGTV